MNVIDIFHGGTHSDIMVPLTVVTVKKDDSTDYIYCDMICYFVLLNLDNSIAIGISAGIAIVSTVGIGALLFVLTLYIHLRKKTSGLKISMCCGLVYLI